MGGKGGKMECENLKDCSFFKEFIFKEHLACSAFIKIYCRGLKKEECARYIFKLKNNRPPARDLLPTGKKQFANRDEIKQKAAACSKDFKCLDGCIEDLCRIDVHLSEASQILACAEHAECPFLQDFGRTKVCGCPIRSAIFKEYGV